MGEHTVRYRDVASFSLDERPNANTYFVLGVRKSGSSILNSIVEALAKFNDVPFVDVAGRLFEAGILVRDWQRDPELRAVLRQGHVYGGFRNCPLCFLGFFAFTGARKVLLVRDPRDALVSEYFSNAYSHSIPPAGESKEKMLASRVEAQAATIDDYVLGMTGQMRRALDEYRPVKKDPLCRVFRYEDVIFEKGRLMSDICDFFGWTITDEQKRLILGWADVIPAQEDPTRFIRRVTPGDHLEKLAPATIARLNEIFRNELVEYGY
jgi:hypothetical protein